MRERGKQQSQNQGQERKCDDVSRGRSDAGSRGKGGEQPGKAAKSKELVFF